MAKHTVDELDKGQLDLMWNFLRFGSQKPNISALKDLCEQLRQAMVQKTGGQRDDDPKGYVKLDDIGTIVNSIVCETMCLYLSGSLDKIGGAKVVDRKQFEKAVEEISEERKYWAMDITDWFELLEEKLFGGGKNASNN